MITSNNDRPLLVQASEMGESALITCAELVKTQRYSVYYCRGLKQQAVTGENSAFLSQNWLKWWTNFSQY